VTTILGGARLLRSRRSRLPEHAQEEMIISMEEESERLYRLVEDLLIIARTELGLESLLEPTALGPILARVSEQFAVRYSKRELETRIEPDLPPASAEQTYVQQVVSNFLSNAYKYSDPAYPIELEARTIEGRVEVRVMDRGPGVEEAELPRIFERFYRSERTSGRASGKGLGLTACKRLVEAMGGEIFAHRREGGGLEIGFRLSVVEEAEEPVEDEAVPGPVSG
jgi:two-component system sensor histidine kinase KdpD